MARLPSGNWLIQQIGSEVVLFHEYTEEEIVRFDPNDANHIAGALEIIAHCEQLTGEDKALAHFWSGYFWAHAMGSDGSV